MAVAIPFLINAAVSIAASYVIGKLFGPKPQNTEGPKLEDRRLQSSTYGASIPWLFGTYRLPGTVIWGTDLIEEATQSSGGGGGKGSPSSGTSTEYNYYGNFAIQLCEGTINGIRRVWADGRLIHNPAYSALTLPFARVYSGSETQLPDPFIETVQGIGKTPAYRGSAYIVFERYALKDYGNRIPNFTFEVERSIDTTVGSQGAPSNPFLGSLSLVESTSPTFIHAVSPSNGAGLYVAGAGGVAMVAVETAAATGQYGFEVAVHTAPTDNAAGAWANGGTFRYSNRGGVNAPARIWPGKSRGRRVVFEQVVTEQILVGFQLQTVTNTKVLVAWLGAAGTTAISMPNESCTLPAAFVGAAQNTNFSLTAASPADRLSCIIDNVAHTTYLIAPSHATNKGGILSSANGVASYAYDFRPLSLAGHRLLDAAFDGTFWYTAERTPAGACVIKKFTSSFNLLSSTPMPAAASDWRISRRGNLTYAIAAPSGAVYIELSGRWCSLGALAAPDAPLQAQGQGRNYSWSMFRPGWALSRYLLVPGSGFDLLPGLGGVYGLSQIITELCARVGVPASSLSLSLNTPINVRGFMVPRPMTARAALETICHAHFVEAVESDGLAKFYPLNRPVVMRIPDEDLDARAYGTEPKALMQLTRAQEVELPKRVTLVYASFNGPLYDYQEAETHAQRLTSKAVQEERQDMPIAFKLREAQPIAECHLRRAWLARTSVEFSTQTGTRNNAYTLLEPGDLVTCRGYTLCITDKQEAKGIIQWKAVLDDPAIYPLITATGGIEIETIDPPDEVNEPPVDTAPPSDLGGDGGGDNQPPSDVDIDVLDMDITGDTVPADTAPPGDIGLDSDITGDTVPGDTAPPGDIGLDSDITGDTVPGDTSPPGDTGLDADISGDSTPGDSAPGDADAGGDF
jgi:hypothetical protein